MRLPFVRRPIFHHEVRDGLTPGETELFETVADALKRQEGENADVHQTGYVLDVTAGRTRYTAIPMVVWYSKQGEPIGAKPAVVYIQEGRTQRAFSRYAVELMFAPATLQSYMEERRDQIMNFAVSNLR